MQEVLLKWRSFINKFLDENLPSVSETSILEIGKSKIQSLEKKCPNRKVLDKYYDCDYKIDLVGASQHINKKFDVVLCIEVLEHVEQPFITADEVVKLIKSGGYLIVSTPSFLFHHPMGEICGDHWRFLPPKSHQLLFPSMRVIKQEVCHHERARPLGMISLMRKGSDV